MPPRLAPRALVALAPLLAGLAPLGGCDGATRCRMASIGAVTATPTTTCLVVSGVPPNTDLMDDAAPDTCAQPVLRLASTCPLPATISGDYTPSGVAVTVAPNTMTEVGIRLDAAITQVNLRYDFEVPVTIGAATILLRFSASTEASGGG